MEARSSGAGTTRTAAGWPWEWFLGPLFVAGGVGIAAAAYVAVAALSGSPPGATNPSAASDCGLLALLIANVAMAAGLAYVTWRRRRGARRP